MLIQFEIPDGSDELEELEEITSSPNINLIPSEYCGNIVRGYLSSRVRNQYEGHVKNQSIETLKEKFGKLSDIKKGNKENE